MFYTFLTLSDRPYYNQHNHITFNDHLKLLHSTYNSSRRYTSRKERFKRSARLTLKIRSWVTSFIYNVRRIFINLCPSVVRIRMFVVKDWYQIQYLCPITILCVVGVPFTLGHSIHKNSYDAQHINVYISSWLHT